MGEVNLDEFFCPNEACPDYGKKGKGNISAQLRSCGCGVGGVANGGAECRTFFGVAGFAPKPKF